MLAVGNWKLMREALGHLSWSASDQIDWLGSVMCPDELALDFDAAYQASWLSREAGWISEELSAYLDAIDQHTTALTEEGSAPWSAEGLRSHPTWEQVRGVARNALALMPPEPWTGGSTS
uniref:hypothetical protein n=1 Tax=Herbidospora sakaeratensis TaxID=564415 RepID=UPI0012F8E2D0|nr:hypothetical protein [Herbidospora sakaeratensis]